MELLLLWSTPIYGHAKIVSLVSAYTTIEKPLGRASRNLIWYLNKIYKKQRGRSLQKLELDHTLWTRYMNEFRCTMFSKLDSSSLFERMRVFRKCRFTQRVIIVVVSFVIALKFKITPLVNAVTISFFPFLCAQWIRSKDHSGQFLTVSLSTKLSMGRWRQNKGTHASSIQSKRKTVYVKSAGRSMSINNTGRIAGQRFSHAIGRNRYQIRVLNVHGSFFRVKTIT